VLRRLDPEQGPEQATCRRTLWPDGTVFENVVLGTTSDGRELTGAELDNWVDTFPIRRKTASATPHYRRPECRAGARPNARHWRGRVGYRFQRIMPLLARLLREDPERRVAQKRATGCYHLHRPGARTDGYGGRD